MVDAGSSLRKAYAEVSIQTDPDNTISDDISFCYVWQDSLSCEVSTQTFINIKNSTQHAKETKFIVPKLVAKKDARVGLDEPYKSGFMGFADLSSDSDMKSMGGISLSVFKILLQFIIPGEHQQPKYYKTLNSENRLLLFLMKMKLGLTFAVLGILFHVSSRTVSSIFNTVLETIYENTKTWVFWPSKDAVKATMPTAFKNYPNCRAIIDCTEIRTDTPPTVEQRALMYSSYKSCFTVKFLIAISPNGLIVFVSKAYGGRCTDGFITNDSGFLNLVEPGDEIMADKGFPQIQTDLFIRKCVLVMPPFALNPQFTREEVLEGYSVASVRIHVERAIQRVKIFKILDHVNNEILPKIDTIIHVACALANSKEPILRNANLND